MSSSIPTGENVFAEASALVNFGIALGSAAITTYAVYTNCYNRVVKAYARNLERGAVNPLTREVSEAFGEISTQEKMNEASKLLRIKGSKGITSYNEAFPSVSQIKDEYARATSKLFKMSENKGPLSVNLGFPMLQRR